MPIDPGTPTSFAVPGSQISFDITQGALGLIALTRRAALIGMKSSAGTLAVNTPAQIFSETEADTKAGKNSELALMARAALRAGRKAKKMPEIWIVALAAPAGVQATYTFTCTGTATADGDVVFRIAGRTLRAGIKNGDVQNTVATNVKNAIDAQAATGDLPGTGSVATNVATFTFTTNGVNGNDVDVSVVSAPAGVTVVAAAGVAGTGVYDITASLDVLIDKHYNAVAIANHGSTDVTDLAAHQSARGAAGVKKWVFGFMAETGTLSAATTLATAANTQYTVVIAAEDFPNMTGEIAAQVAVTRFAESDPSLSMSGVKLDLYAPPAASVFTPGVGGEQDSAINGGTTPLAVTELGEVYIVRLVTTKTTHNSAPYKLLQDFGVFYTATVLGEQMDALAIAFTDPDNPATRPNRKMTAQTAKRFRSLMLKLAREAERPPNEWIHNVEAHKGEFQAGPHATVKTRLIWNFPLSVVPGLEQEDGLMTIFLENAIDA